MWRAWERWLEPTNRSPDAGPLATLRPLPGATDLIAKFPNPKADIINALMAYFEKKKGYYGIAEYVAQCSEAEIPSWLRDACVHLKGLCASPPPALPPTAVPAVPTISAPASVPGGVDDGGH